MRRCSGYTDAIKGVSRFRDAGDGPETVLGKAAVVT